MRRVLAVVCALWASLALADNLPLLGVGSGGAAAPAYTGPGDVITSGVWFWVGTRCFSNAYSGNVASVVNTVTSHTNAVTCSTGGVLSSTPDSISTLTSNCTTITACPIATLYDQSGANKCSSTNCNFTASGTARPIWTTSCAQFTTSGTFCMYWPITTNVSSSGSMAALTQPYSLFFLADDNVVSGIQALINSSIPQTWFNSSSAFTTSGTQMTIMPSAVTANKWFYLFAMYNGASASITQYDSTQTTGLSSGASVPGTSIQLGGANLANPVNVAEVALWSGNQSANFTTMYTNAKSYWGGTW